MELSEIHRHLIVLKYTITPRLTLWSRAGIHGPESTGLGQSGSILGPDGPDQDQQNLENLEPDRTRTNKIFTVLGSLVQSKIVLFPSLTVTLLFDSTLPKPLKSSKKTSNLQNLIECRHILIRLHRDL